MSSALSEINTKQKWWKQFTKQHHHQQHQLHLHHHLHPTNSFHIPSIFGTPLTDSLQIASVAISMLGPDKKPYIYGFIPVIVAKCGLYLKEHATQIEGIFRISGSTKRIKQLQTIFSQPPYYGKDLEWSHHPPSHSDLTNPNPILPSSSNLKPYFSVHDAANLLRRYLMCLPEPLITQSMYEDLRQVLAKYPGDKARQIRLFKSLISTLNPSTQYLLLYLLDLLAVFANRSDKNLMTANNLAVVFQPALCPANPTTQDKLNRIIYAQQISTNNHNQYSFKNNNNHHQTNTVNELGQQPRSSIQQESLLEQESIMKHVKQAQAVVEFLILNQNHFVIGLRPQPRPNDINLASNHLRSSLRANSNASDDSKVYDSSNLNGMNEEEGKHNRTESNPVLISTPRPSSSQSVPQKQQQQQQQQALDDPQSILRRRRSSNLRRSHTLPTNRNNHPISASSPNHPLDWNGIMTQSVGSPAPSSHHQSPPEYDSSRNNQLVTDIS